MLLLGNSSHQESFFYLTSVQICDNYNNTKFVSYWSLCHPNIKKLILQLFLKIWVFFGDFFNAKNFRCLSAYFGCPHRGLVAGGIDSGRGQNRRPGRLLMPLLSPSLFFPSSYLSISLPSIFLLSIFHLSNFQLSMFPSLYPSSLLYNLCLPFLPG